MTSNPTRDEAERHPHWAVTVETSGEHIVRLETECYGGRELSAADEATIRTAAHHLLAFIGDGAPDALRERLEAAEAELLRQQGRVAIRDGECQAKTQFIAKLERDRDAARDEGWNAALENIAARLVRAAALLRIARDGPDVCRERVDQLAGLFEAMAAACRSERRTAKEGA